MPTLRMDFQSYLHELSRAQLVSGVEEGVCDALLAGPAGAADAVDVVLDGEREGEVEDVLDAGDVEAARRHVGRHQDGHGALPEVIDGADPLVLQSDFQLPTICFIKSSYS